MQKIRTVTCIDQNGTFGKKDTKDSPNLIPVFRCIIANKHLHNFHKRSSESKALFSLG